MKRLTVLLNALLLLQAVVAPAQSLSQRIERHFVESGLTPEQWGILVTDSNGMPLYGHNADRLMIPASNAKLAVASTALALLGPDFRVSTAIYATARVDSVVHGDLVLYGQGDPGFSRRCYASDTLQPGVCDSDPADQLRKLVEQLRQRGIRRVEGGILADGTWFESLRTHPSWDPYDLGWYYAAPVSGLAYNDNALDVTTTAGQQVGSRPRISIAPDLGLATFTSDARVGAPGSARTYDIFRNAAGDGYRATGSVPAGTSKLEWPAVADPDLLIGMALRAELIAAGIEVQGAVHTARDSMVTFSSRQNPPLAIVRSRPLRDWLFPILNASQNLFAEMLLKQIGRAGSGHGSWEHGLGLELGFLRDSVGVPPGSVALVDGSGLSANNRITPAALVKILHWLWHGPQRDLVLEDLPLSGASGTLQRRLNGIGLAGKVHAKTGVIGGVNSLSGYLERSDGSIRVFSILTNGHRLGSARANALIDAVVAEISR